MSQNVDCVHQEKDTNADPTFRVRAARRARYSGVRPDLPHAARNLHRAVPPGRRHRYFGAHRGAEAFRQWLHPVVPENRAGAAGIVGANAAAQAKPDGHTPLIVNVGVVSINPSLYAKLPYNPDTAFAPVSLICELPFVLMASPKLQANSVKELIALAKANPDKVTYAIGQRRIAAPHGRDLPAGDRHAHDARAVQGRRAGDDRPHGRPRQIFVRLGARRLGPYQGRKLKGLAVTHAKRIAPASRRADDRRGRCARRRSGWIALRACGHAEGDHRQGRRRCEGGGRVTRGARQADRAGRGAAGEHAGGAQKLIERTAPATADYSRQGLEGRIEG